jgi:plastocyanin
MKAKFAIVLISLALVAAACNKQNANSNPPGSDDQSSAAAPSTDVLSGEATISVTNSGFSPASITVKKGTKVTFVNNGTNPVWPASNPHPTHTDYPGFDALSAVAPGQSWSFTFDRVGRWGFHNHLNPTQGGQITVVE